MSWTAVAASAVGAGIGLLGNKGGGSGTVVQNTDPWSGVQPYLRDLFARGQGLLSQPLTSAATDEGRSEAMRIARGGQPLVDQAQAELGKTLGGGYLDVDNNPYLQKAAQRGVDQALLGVNARFGPEGYGGSANREWATRIASEAAIPIYAGEYQRERDRMFSGIGAAPALSQASYFPSSVLREVGQQQTDDPWTQLTRYRGLLTGTPGGTTTTTSPIYGGNATAGALGGALAGLSIYNQWPRAPSEGDYNSFVSRGYDAGFGDAWTNMSDPAYG